MKNKRYYEYFYSGLLLVTAVWILVHHSFPYPPSVLFLTLFAMHIATQWLNFSGKRVWITLTIPVVLLAVKLFNPAEVVWLVALAIIFGQLMLSYRWPVVLFNVSNLVIAAQAALLVYPKAAALYGPWWGYIAFFFIYFIVNWCCTQIYLFLQGQLDYNGLKTDFPITFVTQFFGAVLGLIAIYFYRLTDFISLLFIFIPILVVIGMMKYYLQAREANRQLSILYEMAQKLASSLRPEELLSELLVDCRKIIPFESAVCYLLADDGVTLYPYAQLGPAANLLKEQKLRLDWPAFQRFAGLDSPQHFPDSSKVWADSELPGEILACFRSLIVFPIRSSDKLLGVFAFGMGYPGGFPRESLRLMQVLAGQLGLSIARSNLYKEMEHMSITDGATGLFNQRYFFQQLQKEISRAQRYGNPLSLLIIDIDLFKTYNDKFGHVTGDKVLFELAQLIRQNVRSFDIVCRYGGEEFTVILPETGIEGAVVLAERLRAMVEKFPFTDAHETRTEPVTISIGAASYPAHASDPDGLIRAADMALYRAKELRNRVCRFAG